MQKSMPNFDFMHKHDSKSTLESDRLNLNTAVNNSYIQPPTTTFR